MMLVGVCSLMVLVPVLSATAPGSYGDMKCVSPPPPADSYGGRPPSGGSPPHHGGGGGRGTTPYSRPPPPPSCDGGGGRTPTVPGTGPTTPTTPGGGGGGGYNPAPPTAGSPPLVLSPPPTPFIGPGTPPTTPYINPGTGGYPPGILPGTPGLPGILPGTPGLPGILPGTPGLPGIIPGTPIFMPDPNSNPFSGTCDFWRNNPGVIWGLLGWWGSLGGIFGTSSLPSVSPSMSLPQALSIPRRADGFAALYREASASYLNSMAYRHFPYSPKQVREQFAAALPSNRAAGHQARVFKLANEGRLKPRV
uniref:Protodermal factor 1 n=1 Tax=Kalanchoe fedtschenkoi TaxID=63787 RepID=A0A7N0RJB9_KALFE